MKIYHRNNFFKHTFCEWKEIPLSFIAGKKPNHQSKAGSQYYFDEEGVARYSNHWGRAANCRWRLLSDNKNSNGYYLGYAKWSDFFPNNENERLYAIIYDKKENYVTFQHKGCLNDVDTVFRTAEETGKRISKIKEILSTDSWFKYFENIEKEEAREFLVNNLIFTNEDFNTLRKRLFNFTKEKK